MASTKLMGLLKIACVISPGSLSRSAMLRPRVAASGTAKRTASVNST